MLTPAFRLDQDENYLKVFIKAPFAKVAETEIFIEDADFKFFSKPYFLRLSLPGHIIEDGRETANYNFDTGEFTVIVPKKTAGEHFDGLDMLTKLLAPKSKTVPSNLIEVLDSSADQGEGEIEEDFDWCIEQVPYTEPTLAAGEAVKYGFANQKSGVFERLQEDMVCIVDCPDPDRLTVAERRELRLQAEWEKFDEDHYISDLYEDDTIQKFSDFTPLWCEDLSASQQDIFTEEEQEVLRKLPRKEYLLTASEETNIYLGLVDILYAYAYNHRTTEGETQCESGWTISKISATLSWLEVFTSVSDVIKSCFRRSLCYPLYRHWNLCERVLRDVVELLKSGRRKLLKILLEIRGILMDQDCRYVLNDLYITDYCVWIQSASPKRLQKLAEAILKVNITKGDLGLNLTEIEELAEAALKEVENVKDIDELTDKLDKVTVDNRSKSDDSDTSTGCDTDSDDITSDSDDVNTDTDNDQVGHESESDAQVQSDNIVQNTGDIIAGNESSRIKAKVLSDNVNTDAGDVIAGNETSESEAKVLSDNVNTDRADAQVGNEVSRLEMKVLPSELSSLTNSASNGSVVPKDVEHCDLELSGNEINLNRHCDQKQERKLMEKESESISKSKSLIEELC